MKKQNCVNTDTDSFIVYIKDDINKDIAEDIETRFDRPYTKGKNKNKTGQ